MLEGVNSRIPKSIVVVGRRRETAVGKVNEHWKSCLSSLHKVLFTNTICN